VAAPIQPAPADAAPVSSRRDITQATASAVSLAAAPASSRGGAGSASGDAAGDSQANVGSQVFQPVVGARVDAAAPVPAGDPVAAPSAAPALVAVPVPVSGHTPELAFRPIDMPAVARFEQTLASIDPDTRNLQAMVRTVRLFSGVGGASEARLQLDPEHLGPVALTVRVEQGTVSAHFRAETPAAQRWIETHQQELRSSLREQGLEVRDVVVTTDPDARRERRQDAPQARPARARRNAGSDADLPRFEVLV
jgi:flagellar hook-length control protein FliK